MQKIIVFILSLALLSACKTKKDEQPAPAAAPSNDCPASTCIYPDTSWVSSGNGPHLIFKFKFDSTQVRLNNLGQASTIPSGNAGFSPIFNRMAGHYIELAQNDLTAVGAGAVLYHAPETSCGGSKAITFCQSVVVREGVPFFSIPISQIAAGSYKWLRVSLSYQNYDIAYKTSVPTLSATTQWGTVASFLGYSTYVSKFKIKTQEWVPSSSVGGPNVNHLQGYWAFESAYIPGYGYYLADGQSQAGATTVVNPNPSSPIPAGSCLVTGEIVNSSGSASPLVITGNETQDIIITVSLSTNKSFEWHEVVNDGYYQPDAGEYPVDMGIRGMIPKVN